MMKALVFDGDLRMESDRARPRPGPGETLIRVRLAGICQTDIEIIRGYMDFRGVPGHEFVGEVKESKAAPEWVGKRVVGEINAGCGRCEYCRRGLERHCPERTTLGIAGRDGCLAEYLTLPAANLVAVPDELPDETAVFAEPLAAALEIMEQVHIPPGSRLLILGDGRLGLLCALALQSTLADITLAGRHPSKLRIAAGAGARAVPVDALEPGRFDFVVEATGTLAGFEEAVRRTRPRGTLVLKSTSAERRPLDLSPLVVDEIRVVGSRCGRFPAAIKALERGLDPRPLIKTVYPLDRALEAFDVAEKPESLKILLDMRLDRA